MRTLRFIVENQLIRPDPNCDFSGLVPGSKGYLNAEFVFSSEWAETAKIASFYSMLGKEFPYRILEDGKSCEIPEEALKRRSFKIQLLGKNGDTLLVTNKVVVNQNGGKS